MNRQGLRLMVPAVLLLATTAPLSAQTADIVLLNGNIITVDERIPAAEALAIQGDRILAVGTNDEIDKLTTSTTRVIDLQGKTVVPGLIDGHLHFAGLGADRGQSLELGEAKSEADAAAQVGRLARRLEPGEWITGSNWHTGNWEREEWPTKESLDRVAPDNPVLLSGMHGHATWANSKALELAGITRSTPDPLGGKVLKDEVTGEPIGILIENAQALARRSAPARARESLAERITKSVRLALSYGFTGAHDMGTSLATIEAYKELIDADSFPFRINAIPRVVNAGPLLDTILAPGPTISYGDHRLTVRSVKVSIDGALGSRGAALMRPYTDEPHNIGVIRVPYDQLYYIVQQSLAARFSVAIHAIGDRGNRMALDAVEEALRVEPVEDHRIRIEHAQIVQLKDLPRLGELGILASVQWMHQQLDMPWAEKRVGPERIKGGYAWRTLMNTGARLVGGSDEGAATFSPFMGIYAAVTRQDREGWPEGGWYADQKLTRMEALRSYTIDAAYASFQEDILGSLAPGKLADLTVLSKDIMTIPVMEILDTHAVLTIVGGKVVFERT
jgi:predicted amidohydrolase YtcJ